MSHDTISTSSVCVDEELDVGQLDDAKKKKHFARNTRKLTTPISKSMGVKMGVNREINGGRPKNQLADP